MSVLDIILAVLLGALLVAVILVAVSGGANGKEAKGGLEFPVAPEWTREHMENWQRFLSSQTGKAFLARLHAVEYANAVSACADKMAPGNAACRAGGFTDCIKTIKSWSISCARDEQRANASEAEQGDPSLAELRSFIARTSP